MKGIFETKKDKTISIEEQVEPSKELSIENKGEKAKKHPKDSNDDMVAEAASLEIGMQIVSGI